MFHRFLTLVLGNFTPSNARTHKFEVTLLPKKDPLVVIDLSADSDWEDEDDAEILEIPPPPVFTMLTPMVGFLPLGQELGSILL